MSHPTSKCTSNVRLAVFLHDKFAQRVCLLCSDKHDLKTDNDNSEVQCDLYLWVVWVHRFCRETSGLLSNQPPEVKIAIDFSEEMDASQWLFMALCLRWYSVKFMTAVSRPQHFFLVLSFLCLSLPYFLLPPLFKHYHEHIGALHWFVDAKSTWFVTWLCSSFYYHSLVDRMIK